MMVNALLYGFPLNKAIPLVGLILYLLAFGINNVTVSCIVSMHWNSCVDLWKTFCTLKVLWSLKIWTTVQRERKGKKKLQSARKVSDLLVSLLVLLMFLKSNASLECDSKTIQLNADRNVTLTKQLVKLICCLGLLIKQKILTSNLGSKVAEVHFCILIL